MLNAGQDPGSTRMLEAAALGPGYFAGGSRLRKGSATSSCPLRLLKNIKAINPHPMVSEKNVPRPSAIQPCLVIATPELSFQNVIAHTPAAKSIVINATRIAIRPMPRRSIAMPFIL